MGESAARGALDTLHRHMHALVDTYMAVTGQKEQGATEGQATVDAVCALRLRVGEVLRAVCWPLRRRASSSASHEHDESGEPSGATFYSACSEAEEEDNQRSSPMT